MKKGLSVLLIAAALFGFYGGATSLNDILASKDYWEEVGEKSTADMNKLEDGLNQLKDNEKAYLDGQEELAEGEAKLADAEKQLADGEKQIADGEAELAQGYADYKAAPKKLAAGRAAVAKGESDLSSLGTLINGINQVLDAYPAYREGYETLKAGRVKVLGQVPGLAPTLTKIQTLLTKYGQTDALKSLGTASSILQSQNPASVTNKDYDDFNTALVELTKVLQVTGGLLSQIDGEVVGIKDGAVKDGKTLADLQATLLTDDMDLGKAVLKQKGYTDAQIEEMEKTPEGQAIIKGAGQQAKSLVMDGLKETLGAKSKDLMELVGAFDPDELSKVQGAIVTIGTAKDAAAVAGAIGTLRSVLGNVHAAIVGLQGTLGGFLNAKEGLPAWTAGYAAIQEKRTDTKAGLPYLSGGIAQIIGGVYSSGNKELIGGMEKAAAAFGFNAKSYTPVATSTLTKDLASNAWMENFYNDGNKIEKAFKAVKPQLNKKYSSGQKELAAGKKTLRQGEADYKAAPAKLADGERRLAEGKAELADGYKQYEDGKKQLADGKKKLGEYEDGEQQVRDGLATLMATEADPGLKSILERRNGDDKFDDANGHLMLDEGLEAVETGRGYQADSGDLITKEITNRAVGTAAGIGACALAVLAAVLSFLKKNKGAAISAVLAAVAGCAGTVVGMGAGQYYSDIAGSTVGSMPFIAAGITAAIALVFAIVHFTAKPEAK